MNEEFVWAVLPLNPKRGALARLRVVEMREKGVEVLHHPRGHHPSHCGIHFASTLVEEEVRRELAELVSQDDLFLESERGR